MAGSSFFGESATIASVVIIGPAMDAAFCSAVRVALIGSRMLNSKTGTKTGTDGVNWC